MRVSTKETVYGCDVGERAMVLGCREPWLCFPGVQKESKAERKLMLVQGCGLCVRLVGTRKYGLGHRWTGIRQQGAARLGGRDNPEHPHLPDAFL